MTTTLRDIIERRAAARRNLNPALTASFEGIDLDWDTPIADAAKHRRISYEKRADAQRKAWVKRREKYGPRGRR